MRLKVLGAYGASDAGHNLTGYLIDGRIAVDAGTLTSKLTLAQQARIEAVFITHAHADHVRDLPHLIHNRFNQNVPPLSIIASQEVMGKLTQYLFDGEVWPDFAKFKSPATGKSAVEYHGLKPGRKTKLHGASFTVIPVHHSVVAAGVILEVGGQNAVFTGDTGPTVDLWKRVNRTDGVVAIVTEASFPNQLEELAIESGHLSPRTFGTEIAKIKADAPVYASHRKIPYEKQIEFEIRSLRDRRARVLFEKEYTL